MKKTFKRILKITFLSVLTGALTITAIILFPQQLFAKKLSYKKFTVYSNDKVDDNIKAVLDNALTLVQKSELYDPDFNYNIILCYNSFYNKIDDKVLGVGPTARARFKNVVIKVRIDAKKNLIFPVFHKACEENLTEILAHEMIHCLQTDRKSVV